MRGALFRCEDGGDSFRRTLDGYVKTYVGWDLCNVRGSGSSGPTIGANTGAPRVRDCPGRTWESIASNLPSEPVNVLAEDPRDENTLYIGTDLGMYAPVDGGGSWNALSRDLPTAAVVDLAIHSPESPPGPILVAEGAGALATAGALKVDPGGGGTARPWARWRRLSTPAPPRRVPCSCAFLCACDR